MSRIPKYRAWDKQHNVMRSWGELVVSHGMVYICDFFDQEDYVFMEYIGRLDHHDIEMCEGDVVEYIDNTSHGLVKKITVIRDIRHLPDFSCSKWEEIIGNVWQNRDLLWKVSNELG